MPRFLVDAQLPPGHARRLVEYGYDAVHINDTDLRETADRDIWNFAARNDYVVISKDADFVILANLSPKGPPIVWVRLGNVDNARLWRSFEPLPPTIVARLARGEILIEVSPLTTDGWLVALTPARACVWPFPLRSAPRPSH